MRAATAIALVLELASAALVNLAYVREHSAAAALPPLSLGHPLRSLTLLLRTRRWLEGFAMETTGFGLYVAALALASLALVQTVGASGLGLLAFGAARLGRQPMRPREWSGAVIAAIGLALLGVSLATATGQGDSGNLGEILPWLSLSAAAALAVLTIGRRMLGEGTAYAIAAGLLFSIGDISTKLTTQGGGRVLFAITLIAGYALGTSLLQLGYQRGGALEIAGVATLLTNALPIAAGMVLLDEPLPHGVLGVVRIAAFATVLAGAVLLGDTRRPLPPPASPGSAAARESLSLARSE
jgi:hypothetical protein